MLIHFQYKCVYSLYLDICYMYILVISFTICIYISLHEKMEKTKGSLYQIDNFFSSMFFFSLTHLFLYLGLFPVLLYLLKIPAMFIG